ncbi:polysaccharide deacetylase family protein [Spirillospora sp. NPDC029432]|uniref:polysaccharide deacetylase family protein n=1 Tax=Spirillospora sp. NPDC029432 TaxID=3154599 RepID=UPI0034573358
MNRPAGDEPIASMPMVLMYHSVDHYDEDPHLVTVTPERFERQLRWLHSRGLRGVSVYELLRAHARGRTRGLVGLTFDDGYADFATRAVPALVRYGFTATVFVVTGRIGAYNAWDTGPPKALMTREQIRAVADFGMEVASHTVRHVSLPEASDDEVREELLGSRAELEEIVQRPIGGFAYPYGHATPRDAAAVRAAGYDYGCAIRPAEATRFTLARTYVGERDRSLRLRAKVVRHELQWLVRV